MKTNITKLLFFLAVTATLTGCLEGGSNYTPSLYTSYFVTTKGDTIKTFVDEDNEYHLDTLALGDTVRFVTIFECYTNNIVTTSIKWDSTYVHLSSPIDSVLASVLTEQSKPKELYYRYKPGYSRVGLSISMVPIKAGNSKLRFAVESDADSKKIPNTSEATLNLHAE